VLITVVPHRLLFASMVKGGCAAAYVDKKIGESEKKHLRQSIQAPGYSLLLGRVPIFPSKQL
jgi:hypothetical protein